MSDNEQAIVPLAPVDSPDVEDVWFGIERTACTDCSGSLYGSCETCGYGQLGQLRRENARMRAAIEAVLAGSAELEALRKAIE